MSFEDFLKVNNIKEPDHYLHYYDYKKAWKNNAMPDSTGHWPSEYKHDLHPNRYIKHGDIETRWYDTKHGVYVEDIEVKLQSHQRAQFEKKGGKP